MRRNVGEVEEIKEALKREGWIHCMDKDSYTVTLSLALKILLEDGIVKAEIVRGWGDCYEEDRE